MNAKSKISIALVGVVVALVFLLASGLIVGRYPQAFGHSGGHRGHHGYYGGSGHNGAIGNPIGRNGGPNSAIGNRIGGNGGNTNGANGPIGGTGEGSSGSLLIPLPLA